MLEDVSGGVLQVLILTEHVEVPLRVFVKDDAVVEVDRVLLPFAFLAFADLAFF